MTFLETLAGVAPSTRPSGAVDDGLTTLPDDAPKGTHAARLIAAQQLEQLKIMQQSLSQMAAQWQGFLTDSVLGFGTFALDANGFYTRQFKAPIGALVVRNLSPANTITVCQASGSAGGGAPTTGNGIMSIPAGAREPMPWEGTSFSVYGNPGDRFTFAAFARGALPTT